MFEIDKTIRKRVLEHILRNPQGTNITKVATDVVILRTTATKHLNLLLAEGLISEYKQGMARVFYPPFPKPKK